MRSHYQAFVSDRRPLTHARSALFISLRRGIDVCGRGVSNAYVTYRPLNINVAEVKPAVIRSLSAFAGW